MYPIYHATLTSLYPKLKIAKFKGLPMILPDTWSFYVVLEDNEGRAVVANVDLYYTINQSLKYCYYLQ